MITIEHTRFICFVVFLLFLWNRSLLTLTEIIFKVIAITSGSLGSFLIWTVKSKTLETVCSELFQFIIN